MVVHLTFIDVTGLIYVAIVALWAAVLIPMWLRRHDDDQARRIERHRVAMGTLARIADEPLSAQGTAARRRRVVLASTATVGALGTAAWVAGLMPGALSIALWLPLVAFVPAVVISERRSKRDAAERALLERRVAHASRDVGVMDDSVTSMEATVGLGHAAPAPRLPAPVAEWEEVFDQTA